MGLGLQLDWTPCTGPILAGVIALGVSDPGRGLFYMLLNGFSIPFLLMSLFIDKMTFLKTHIAVIMTLGGILMVLMGVLLYFNMMTKIITFLTPLFGGFTGF